MPVSVSDLFNSCGIDYFKQSIWGGKIESNCPGVYVITVSDNPSFCLNPHNTAPIDETVISRWIDLSPGMRIDKMAPTAASLTGRFSDFWIPDETILYIGKAGTSIKKRLNQFFRYDYIGSRGDTHRGRLLAEGAFHIK